MKIHAVGAEMFRAERRTDLHVKYPLFFSDFHVKLVSLDRFPKIKISIFMKIHGVGAEMFRAERRTDLHVKYPLFF